MSETRKLAAILATDVAGYSRPTATDEERTVARLRALRSDLFDPAMSLHHGRVVKRTGDGILIEFRSVVDAVRCSIEVQNGMVEPNAGLPPERQILLRAGIHLGDVIEEEDGDLMGDGVNIASRLESICEPGAILLSEDAYRHVRSRLDLAVTDLGNKELKNIPEPVHIFSVEVGNPALARPARPPISVVAAPRPKKRSILLPLAAGIAALIVIVAAGAWYFRMRPDPGPGPSLTANAPAHFSIGVLPFANLSRDPDQDYFADGITENLTTELSRIKGSFVIARNTAFTYNDKSIDAKEIGKELGVRYVLEGSVQRDQGRVRINARLVDAETGAHPWADRFEEGLADLFKLQDEVVARLAASLYWPLVEAEAGKGARSKNPDAIDLAMHGRAMYGQAFHTKDKAFAARAVYEQALKIDPDNAEALAGEARTYLGEYVNGWMTNTKTDYDAKILVPVDRAVALAPDNLLAHYVKAIYLAFTHRESEAIGIANAGLAINPNYAPLYVARMGGDNSLGRFEQARSDVQLAMRLSPRDLATGQWHFLLSNVELESRHFDAAIDEAHKGIDAGYRVFPPYAILTAAYALEGKPEEAKAALAEARRLNPNLTLKWLRAHSLNSPLQFEGLRKAGLQEDEGPRLSIVVLPFENLSGDATQDYLADVLKDELTTYISRIPGSFVIARNTAFTYKGKPTDAKQIGKDLGVRYVLEGSVQPTDKRIRTNAQLIDTETGTHLWAEEFDTDKTDLLETQDEIVTRLARALDIATTQVEAAKGERGRPENPDAQDLALRCLANFNANLSIYDPKQIDKLDAPCDEALKLDPKNLIALRLLATRHAQKVYRGISADPLGDIRRAKELIERAFAIDPNDAGTHAAMAGVLFDEGRNAESITEARKAIDLNPSDLFAYFLLCGSENAALRAQDAIEHADHAIRLSPHDPTLYLFYFQKAWAFRSLRRYDEALPWSRRAFSLTPNSVYLVMRLAADPAHQGHLEEADKAYERAISLPGGVKLRTIRQWRADADRRFSEDDPADVKRINEVYFEDLRKAGMPEQ